MKIKFYFISMMQNTGISNQTIITKIYCASHYDSCINYNKKLTEVNTEMKN